MHGPPKFGWEVSDCFTYTRPPPLLERLVIRCQLDRIILFDGYTPRLRELAIDFIDGLRLQHRPGNLTSIHLTFPRCLPEQPYFPSSFDILYWSPLLEEMFLSGDPGIDALESWEHEPTIPLHCLRKLRISSFSLMDLECVFRMFDLKPDGIAIHLSDVVVSLRSRETVETIFPKDNSGRPSLFTSTKLGVIFHTRPQTIIVYAVGPGFSIKIDVIPDNFGSVLPWSFFGDFPSVRELWFRGSRRMNTRLYGLRRFTALEKLVLVGRRSKLARNLRQLLSSNRPPGGLPCPLPSTIDCHGNASEIREISLLARTRSGAGLRLAKLNVPTRFIPLPTDTSSCVGEVGSFDIPSDMLHMYAVELPEYCFVDGEHGWWQPWKSRLYTHQEW